MSPEPSANDDFYVGYDSTMAPRLARRIRVAAAGLLLLAVALPLLLIAAQSRFAAGVFEFGRARVVEGRLVEFPYPALDVDGPTQVSYWLVGPGKHGAATLVRGLDGRRVRLRGSLIERDGEKMLQIVPDGIETLSAASRTKSSVPVRIRTVRVVGELVDSKCHLGVMKPGEGPLHRDCAVRCLLGAVPPMISEHGTGLRLALMRADGSPFFSDFPALAGRPLSVRGTLVRQGARKFLAVGLDDIEIIR
jgi:hypothetical protein